MQVAIVTGASSGIGFGCATKLAQVGMAVLGVGRDENRSGTGFYDPVKSELDSRSASDIDAHWASRRGDFFKRNF